MVIRLSVKSAVGGLSRRRQFRIGIGCPGRRKNHKSQQISIALKILVISNLNKRRLVVVALSLGRAAHPEGDIVCVNFC